ncbi:phosphoadenosine phosphosulfate reductase domain-containing protein [Pyrococcus yayanosii]|uniref:Phosphoadenosine phosphosulfate reductase family protein n=1 Tax=Pyrococcus yayanosii (strain CH1 / JCM 16557) TaxID=529709 RepID=F8AHI2_PYRYC|nr:phosphoadenosine phosphosulfate reductase family protein [Pyrococcus yayanosii]AEH25353.1 Phosphoadenosine phosphosulfate reductase family protein [Pyrococcus yayanosii CH1]
MRRGPVFLGRSYVYWCERCNVPLIQERCDVHGEEGVFRIEVTPPGDLRFAFERDLALIRRVFLEHYGVDVGELFEGKIVLLNKIPGEDDAYEIIFDGFIFGIIKFDPKELRWKPGLKLEGAKLLWERFGKEMRKWVIIDEGAIEPVRNGANVLPIGILEAEESIKVGDEVIIVGGNEVVGVGIAKKDYAQLMAGEKGTGIKVKRKVGGGGRCLSGRRASIEDVIKANLSGIEEKVKEAREFMRRIAERFGLPVAVAFSGGKDSLAVLGLALEEFGKGFAVFFNNTGIEFPETIEYVDEIRRELEPRGIRFVVADAGDAFWRALHVFSPPGMDYRWCCKVTKLGPITLAIKEHFPQGVLMFVGQRKYESFKRFKQGRVWRNKWVPNEIGASPIFHWNALEVWLYIFSRGLKFNQLYKKGLDRIGCFLCPSQSLAEMHRLREEKPELWAKWERELERWRRRFNLPREWITYGFWRWRRLGGREKKLAEALGLDIPAERFWEPVRAEIREEEGRFVVRFNTVINEGRILEVAPILGEVFEGGRLIRAGSVELYPGTNVAIAPTHEEAVRTYYLVKRAYECVGCGVCVGKCPTGAIGIDPRRKKILVDPGLCTHCGECMEVCPLLKIKNPEEGSQL